MNAAGVEEAGWSLGEPAVDSGVARAVLETGITDIGERHLEGVRLDAEGAIRAAVFAESSENTQRVDGGGSGRTGRGGCRGGIGGSDVDCSGIQEERGNRSHRRGRARKTSIKNP